MIARTLLPVVVLMLLATSPAWAVPASVQATAYSNNPGDSSVAATFNASVSAGSCLAVAAWTVDGTSTFSSFTSSPANSFTITDSVDFAGMSVAMAYAKNATPGATTVTVNLGTARRAWIVIEEISGCDTTNPLDGHALSAATFNGSGTDLWASASITTTAAGDFIWGLHFDGNVVAACYASPGTGFALPPMSRNRFPWTEHKIQATAGSVNAPWSVTDTTRSHNVFLGVMAFRAGN